MKRLFIWCAAVVMLVSCVLLVILEGPHIRSFTQAIGEMVRTKDPAPLLLPPQPTPEHRGASHSRQITTVGKTLDELPAADTKTDPNQPDFVISSDSNHRSSESNLGDFAISSDSNHHASESNLGDFAISTYETEKEPKRDAPTSQPAQAVPGAVKSPQP